MAQIFSVWRKRRVRKLGVKQHEVKQHGAALVEYSLLVALIAVVAIPAIRTYSRCNVMKTFVAGMAISTGGSCGAGFGSPGCTLDQFSYIAAHFPVLSDVGLDVDDIFSHTC